MAENIIQYVDSHCHLNRLADNVDEGYLLDILNQAKEHGVTYFLCVAITLAEFPVLRVMAKKHPNIFISAGLHPNEDPEAPLDQALLSQFAQEPEVIAIGETGLDYYRSTGDLDWQRERFIQHIECAKACQKPIIVHTREAKADTLAIMKAHGADHVGGVMHCFTEDWETAKKALDLNFYISFSGIVTFKNATVIQDVARKVPLDRMLIETDSPYLAPNPHRGKPNVPAFVHYVGEYIAELRGIGVSEVARHTTGNFFKLFRG